MAESPTKTLRIPGLKPIPYVVVKLATGQVVIRHPDEVQPLPGSASPPMPPGHGV